MVASLNAIENSTVHYKVEIDWKPVFETAKLSEIKIEQGYNRPEALVCILIPRSISCSLGGHKGRFPVQRNLTNRYIIIIILH